MNGEYIFALDIGTRTVIGLLCRIADSGEVLVEHYHVEWHPKRAMLDGQIHEVAQVSAVLARVREALEEKAGCSLKGVAIAAAGRALTTLRVTEKIELSAPREIDQEDVHQLEVKALAAAREEMAKKTASLYCVGFSPVAYYLNNLVIANPRGQRGSSIGVEIIATFLPQIVVDSLFSSVAKAGLVVESLTLEPIAAMAVAVPHDLRMLNLALVDIGAGTSDIAVSREGTIVAYGMVDMAGDEVTEVIAQHYLLDFNSAENIKKQLSQQEYIEFFDVLGNSCRESREAILDVIEPVVDKLARELSDAIKTNNGGVAPAALFCAGGGSLTPLLREKLAQYLELPSERVGIRTRDHLEGVRFGSDDLKGPEIITPLGIAMTAIKPREGHFVRIWLNGQGVTLFNVQKATVAQALFHSGLDIDAVAGSDTAIQFELNGQIRDIKGNPGHAGRVLVNDAAASLDTQLSPGDIVEVAPGQKGDEPTLVMSELAASFPLPQFVINGASIEVPLVQRINSLPCQPDTVIRAGDKVEIRPPVNIGELAALMDVDISQMTIKVDGVAASYDTIISPGASVAIAQKNAEPAPVKAGVIRVTVNGVELSLPYERSMLAYALAQADIKHTGATRGDLVITVNGKEAEYTALLNSGDRIEVFWAPREH
jgi:cell division protein FtsA